MDPTASRATVINIVGNAFLFALKLVAGLVSGSIALISDALNSFTDVISSVAVFICVKISNKQADEGHPFGHSRAEPIAGLIVAIMAGILGFEVIRSSFERLFIDVRVVTNPLILLVPVVTILIKGGMAWDFRRVGRAVKSPAIMATAKDSIMDVFVSVAALAAIVGVHMGYPILDPAAGFVISAWIIYTGYSIGVENIDYLMGRGPGPELMERIKEAAVGVGGVKDINTVKAHYVGNFVHVEIHIEVDRELSTGASHDIGVKVEERIEAIETIDKSFVHIDPV